ncbi:hypothetical protein [Porphyromonas crevioricanis]|uniref:hypothetical protein n=1 Tax=Porphyromonas crevioricanis TaxID=393921 RepID=UPI00190F75EC|nr:hypothetical protein [Porphyromonas crevioricanis]
MKWHWIFSLLLYFLSLNMAEARIGGSGEKEAAFDSIGMNRVGLRFFGLSWHPHGERENASIMPLRLDRDAYWVQNLGAIISYERMLWADVLSSKAAIALYSDCAAQLGGFVHVGLRGRILKLRKHQVWGGIGPTLIFRKNWLNIDGYRDQNLFKGVSGDKFQYLFLWYAGEFDYRYSISSHWDVVGSFVPGYPDLMSFSLGVNYNFSL